MVQHFGANFQGGGGSRRKGPGPGDPPRGEPFFTACQVDFGTASTYNTSTKANDVRGTPLYMAPEAIKGKATKTSDIWSFGMTVLELLTGQEGWPVTSDMNPWYLMEMIADPKNSPTVPDSLPQDARDFVLRAVDRNPGSRPTAEELLDDAFLV